MTNQARAYPQTNKAHVQPIGDMKTPSAARIVARSWVPRTAPNRIGAGLKDQNGPRVLATKIVR